MIQFARLLVLVGALMFQGFASVTGISGVVVNKTKEKPSARDTVVLIDVSAGMREIARTRSDASGHFRFNTSRGSASQLVQVMHGGVRYDAVISSQGEPVDVSVFDSTSVIADLKTNVQAMRIETGSGYLRINQILTLINSSNPPRTVNKRELFWLAFPQGATLLSSAAQPPQQEIVESVARPAPGEDRCYFDLPLLPGTTKIQLQYQVPYTGRLTFVPHIPFPTESLGVVLPTKMKFESSEGRYIEDSDQYGDLAEVIHDVAAGNAPQFTISSEMSGANARGNQTSSAALTADPDEKRENVSATSQHGFGLHPLLWAAVSVCGALLLVVGRVHRRRSHRPRLRIEADASTASNSIREELFNLELLRVQNRISKASYTESKTILEKRLALLLGNPTHT